ncbi:MAG: hypothetical protein EAY75_18190, partial [Bacteroidetes bacterium]
QMPTLPSVALPQAQLTVELPPIKAAPAQTLVQPAAAAIGNYKTQTVEAPTLQEPPASRAIPDTSVRLNSAPSAGASLLQKIKQQHQTAAPNQVTVEKRTLTTPEVMEIWNAHIETLKTELKHTSVTSCNLAQLTITPNQIDITSASSFNNKAIESELSTLLQTLKQTFHNPDIKIELHVAEDQGKYGAPEPRHLSSNERFRLMATDFPLVRHLKEQLNLEVRY